MEQWNKDIEFYSRIWNTRPHRCFETNTPLYGEILSIYFNHVLDKEKYPQFRYEEWNICLVSWYTHDQWHKDMKKCPKMYEYYLELLNKYVNFDTGKERI